VPPGGGDLGNYRHTIQFALGELSTNVRHQADDIKSLTKKVGKLIEATESGFREQKASIKVIEDKILVAETQVSSAFVRGAKVWVATHFVLAPIRGHGFLALCALSRFPFRADASGA
jgi:hypothetical protein